MKSYNNDAQLKIDMLAEVKRHREADMLVKGTYNSERNGKWVGCAVGCSLHSLNAIRGLHHPLGSHAAYETIGVPVALAFLQDGLFQCPSSPLCGFIPLGLGFFLTGYGWWKIGEPDCRFYHIFLWVGGLGLMLYGWFIILA